MEWRGLGTPAAEAIEAEGMTLMPGLVEGHAHITFINGARPTDLGDTPPEERTSCGISAIVPARRWSAQPTMAPHWMGLGDQAGQVHEGFLADLLLVDCDPVADVGLLQHKDRLVAILKDGEVYKLDRSALERRETRAAE